MQISNVTSQSCATPPLKYTHTHSPQTYKYHHTAHLIKPAYLLSYCCVQNYPAHPSRCMFSRPSPPNHIRVSKLYTRQIYYIAA
jgi:hypothetical protein